MKKVTIVLAFAAVSKFSTAQMNNKVDSVS